MAELMTTNESPSCVGTHESFAFTGMLNLNMTPRFPVLNVRHKWRCNTIVGGNFPQQPAIRFYRAYLGICQLVSTVFLSGLMRPVSKFIKIVSAWCVVSEVFQSVIRAITIVVAYVKSIWLAKKGQSDQPRNRDNSFCAGSSERSDAVSAFAFTRIENPVPCITSWDCRLRQGFYLTKITDHVIAFITGQRFPDFIIHRHFNDIITT